MKYIKCLIKYVAHEEHSINNTYYCNIIKSLNYISLFSYRTELFDRRALVNYIHVNNLFAFLCLNKEK